MFYLILHRCSKVFFLFGLIHLGIGMFASESESESDVLLVIRLMAFIHQDLWYGKLIPSSHQRRKPNHTILCTFNRGNDWIWKGIPISDCLRAEWALVNVSLSGVWKVNEWWFLLRLIGGKRSSVGMLAAPFRPLYKRTRLRSLLLFLRDSHFSFSSVRHTPSFKAVIASNKSSSTILNFFDFLLKNHAFGIPITAAIFQKWGKQVSYMLPEDIDKDFVSGNQEFYLP